MLTLNGIFMKLLFKRNAFKTTSRPKLTTTIHAVQTNGHYSLLIYQLKRRVFLMNNDSRGDNIIKTILLSVSLDFLVKLCYNNKH